MSHFRVKASLGFLLAVSLLVTPVVAPAQGTRTFGTPSVSHTLQAYAFVGRSAADNINAENNGSRFCSGGFCELGAAVLLPAGASVTSIELEACDTDPAGIVGVDLRRVGPLTSSIASLAVASTGLPATPSCALFSQNLATPHTIDNVNNTYFVRAQMTGTDNTTRFQAVRIYYNLQVSLAAATATFNDVPTSHPFFQFIEALVASGITAGCGGGNYCPDAPLTRGQMAVFLSKGLGLHFAP